MKVIPSRLRWYVHTLCASYPNEVGMNVILKSMKIILAILQCMALCFNFSVEISENVLIVVEKR